MNFKKASQIIWMILAFLFIVVLFLHVYSESIYIDRVGGSGSLSYVKHNKLTGQIYAVSPESGLNKWQRFPDKPSKWPKP